MGQRIMMKKARKLLASIVRPLLPGLLLALGVDSLACTPQDAAKSPKQQASQESETKVDLQREAEHEAEMARLTALAQELEEREQELLEANRIYEEQKVSEGAPQEQERPESHAGGGYGAWVEHGASGEPKLVVRGMRTNGADESRDPSTSPKSMKVRI